MTLKLIEAPRGPGIVLTDDELQIFGRPNFACARVAQVLILGGLYEDKEAKAEYEQAVYIHWASSLLKEHGGKWKEVGNKQIADILEELAPGGG